MRSATSSSLQVVSLTLVASLFGCSSDPVPGGGVTPGDAAVDVTATPDMPGSGDTGAPTDTAEPEDTSVFVDVPIVVDPDAPLPPDDVPAATDGPTADVPAGQCGTIAPAVATEVAAMTAMGWGALNRSRGVMMQGCAGATRPQDCLATVPLAGDSTIGSTRSAIAGAHLRVLYTANARSSFWTRSSADGRFVGRGVRIYDLARGVEIAATGGMYDPAFFPDNSGFMYQPGGRLCPQSALTTGMPTAIALTGTGSPCTGSSVGLYEHLAASLSGEDYWSTAAGTAAWDDGGHSATLTETRRNETWGASAQTSLSLMANTGSGFRFVASRNISTPFQGDAVISPSSRSLITRFVDAAGTYQGYVLHRLEATHSGSAIMVTAREVARYCTVGAKPGFSYDERWITYHHYVGGGPDADADAREMGFTGADDARFAEYRTRGASNIYLLDLLTGTRTRVTTMGPGQYALYSHFRSDGWIYFLVRTLGTMNEHVIASDAALLMR